MAARHVYLNGRIVPADAAKISVFDSGLLHGASAFTTMLAHNGKVFRLARHLARLMDTVTVMGLRAGAAGESLAKATDELLRANQLSAARMRITLTGGDVSPVGRADADESATTLITAEPLPEYPRQWYEEGITVIVSPLRQLGDDPLCGYKTGCYFQRVLARQAAAAKGAAEALWYTADNRLAEACYRNVFLVLDGRVHTPPRDTPVLPGVVREAVIELCGELGISCNAETPLTVKEMLKAEEVFLTNSLTGVCPVARIERHAVGGEKPGPITVKLMSAYRELLETECP